MFLKFANFAIRELTPMPTFLKIFLTLVASGFLSGVISAQPKAAGASFSMSGIGFSYEHANDDERFMEISLKAELWEVFNDRAEVPGVTASFLWNLILKSWKSNEDNTLNIFAGTGISAGYTNDYRQAYGCVLGLKGKIGIECCYMRRNIKLSASISSMIGTHIRKENSTLRMDYYKSGIFNTIMPEIGIKYLF